MPESSHKSPQCETHLSTRPRISDRLGPTLADAAAACGAYDRAGRIRADGWTPERKLTFLEILAATGVVADAARAAGMSVQSAYALRNSARGRAFHVAWRAAQMLAYRRVADELLSRALSGVVDVVVHDGVVSERHRFDNRLALALLTRLDQRSGLYEHDPVARAASEEFDQFSRLAAEGNPGAEAFINARVWRTEEADSFERAAYYSRYGVGLPNEIDVTDLDVARRDQWTAEQWERAYHAGLVGKQAKDDQ